jgi:hypothetical protein
VLCGLLEKPALLNGDELKFIRKYLDMSTTGFGKIFGVSRSFVMGTNTTPSFCLKELVQPLRHK